MHLPSRKTLLAFLLLAACSSDATEPLGLPSLVSIGVTLGTPSLSVGQATQAYATLQDSAGRSITITGDTVTWTSSDPAVATISATTGVVTAVKAGATTIVASARGKTGSAPLTVTQAESPHSGVAAVRVSVAATNLVVGRSLQATATSVDANGNAVSGQLPVWSTSDSAVATVSQAGMVTGVGVGTVLVSATTDGMTGTASMSVLPPSLVASLALDFPVSSLSIGATAQGTVTARDVAGDVVTGLPAIWSSSDPGVASVSPTGAVTANAVGTATISVTMDGQVATADITVIRAAVASINIAVAGQVFVGDSTLATAMLFDADGDEITDRTATWMSSNSAVASVSATGMVKALATGATIISAHSEQQTANALLIVVAAPAPPTGGGGTGGGGTGGGGGSNPPSTPTATQLAVVTQPSSSASAGVAFARQPVVKLVDASNNAVSQSGVVITAAVAVGSGTLGGTLTATTNANGIATFTNLMISGATGSRTLLFTANGLSSASSSSIAVSAGAATSLSLSTQPSASAASGVVLSQQPRVQLRDAYNNVVPNAGVVITATIASGAGTLGGTTTATTNSAGVATFTNLVITGAAGARTLKFSATSLSAVTSGTITVGATSTQLAVATQPSASVQSGVAFPLQPTIQLKDVSNSNVAQSGVLVTASIATGNGTLGGTLTATTNASGVATFSNLRLTGTGAFTLKFAAAGLASVTCNTIMVAVTATQLAISTQPSSNATSGNAFAQQPVVQLRDASSNPVAQSGVAVTATIASGGGTLGGTTTAVTNASGAANFSNLSISGGAGPRTLTFSATAVTAATSGTITVAAASAPATQLSIATQPATVATTGLLLSTQPAVQLRDASNNPVSQSGVQVTVSVASGVGALTGTLTSTTNSSGVASFNNLVITGVGTATLRFSSTGLTGVTSSSITVNAAVAGSSDVMSNASFESGWDGFTDWSMSRAPTNASRDASTAYDGSFSLKRSWTPNPGSDNTAQIATEISSAGADHVWLRFYFKLTAPITSIMKFARFYQGTFNSNLGGLFLGSGNDILMFGTDQENSAITTSLGLTQAQVIDGNWHSMEIEYWRNGDPSGYPSAAFWFDGQQLTGTAVKYAGAGNSSYWSNGRLYTGSRKTSNKINVMEWAATLNAGNTTTGQVNIDRVSISTTGRIGQ